MGKAIILGNSHVAAFKVAYDRNRALFGDIGFFAATGLDLAFTKVEDGKIVGANAAHITLPILKQFSPEAKEDYLAKYLAEGRPTKPVADQFLATGGAPEIDLSDVSAIFYVCGASPYDFARHGEGVIPTSTSLRRIILSQALDQNFLLRRQILDLRIQRPELRHFFVGSPLMYTPDLTLDPVQLTCAQQKRANIRSLARDYLFDDVFMPDETLLDPNLLVTRGEFFNSGREAALDFQRDQPQANKTDTYHVNQAYGLHVLTTFVAPNIQTPEPA